MIRNMKLFIILAVNETCRYNMKIIIATFGADGMEVCGLRDWPGDATIKYISQYIRNVTLGYIYLMEVHSC